MKKLPTARDIPVNSLANECYEGSTLDELLTSLGEKADTEDCAKWNLGAEEWKTEVLLALRVKICDLLRLT